MSDKGRPTQRASAGPRGNRRTPESMKRAGVTDGGIALVTALSGIIDERWASRAELLRALEGGKFPVDRKRLSKEMGSKDKPYGPDWHVVEAVVRVSVKGPEHCSPVLAELAGLFCAARSVERPPGYPESAAITWPAGKGGRSGAAVLNEVIVRLQAELDSKISSLEGSRRLYDAASVKLGQMQMQLDTMRRKMHHAQDERDAALVATAAREQECAGLNAQVAVLSQHLMDKSVALDSAVRDGRDWAMQAAAREDEIGRLSQEVLRQSALGVERSTALETAHHTIAVQQRGLRDTEAVLAEHELRSAAADKQHQNLREQYARLAALVARADLLLRRGSNLAQLPVNPFADSAVRALATYLTVHQQHSGKSTGQVAAATGMAEETVGRLLTGHLTPGAQELAKVANAVGAEITHARLLYDEAVGDLEETPATPLRMVDDDPDDFESIVAFMGRDNDPCPNPGHDDLSPAMSRSPGDTDSDKVLIGDNRDMPITALSPIGGDKLSLSSGDTSRIPQPVSSDGTSTVYGSGSSPQRHVPRPGWLETALGLAACLSSLLAVFTLMYFPGVVAGAPVTVAAVCWLAFLIMLTRRRSYRPRHHNRGEPAPPTDQPAGNLDLSLADAVPDADERRQRAAQLARALAGRRRLAIPELTETAASSPESDDQRPPSEAMPSLTDAAPADVVDSTGGSTHS